jgi:uncharacterized protein YjdB
MKRYYERIENLPSINLQARGTKMKTHKNKVLSIILTLSLVFSVFGMTPMTASAGEFTSTLTFTSTNSHSDPTNGWEWSYQAGGTSTLTLTGFNLNSSVGNGINFSNSVTGDVEIVLIGTNNVTGTDRGIFAESAQLLTISGSGTLNATATEAAGSGIYAAIGDITISSGTVNAAGGEYGAGIYAYDQSSSDIIISGGIVNASGDIGIEAGRSILISGGTVNAVGSRNGTYSYQPTTIDGDAIVKATGGSEVMHTYSGSPVFRTKGVVFENGIGTVYGDVTLPGDLTVENGETLTVPDGSTLTVPSGTKITNNGTITNDGTVINNGAISGNAITGNGTIVVPPTKVSKVTITNNTGTYTYKAADSVHTMQHAVSILPANATVKTVTWKSSNNQLATVNAAGLVTFTGKEGTVRITATSPDGPSHYKDIKVVKNVTKLRTPLTARNLTVKKKISVAPVIDDGSTVITAELTYKSSNPNVATVDANGNVKGIKVGKTTITIQSHNGRKATVKINVAKKAVALKKFTLTGIKKNALSLTKGKTKDLKIKLAQSKASDLKISFKSSKSSVAKVDAAGRITAVKKGTATITVKVGSKTVKVKVTVK